MSLAVVMYLVGCFLDFLAGRGYEREKHLREEAQQQEGEAQ